MEGKKAEQSNVLEGKTKPWVSIALFLGLFEILFLNGMGRTVGPNIVTDLGNVSMFSLMYTVFFLCSTCAMPFSTKIGAKIGRKTIIMIGILLYSIATFNAGLSSNMVMHTIFRGLQGLGQGLMLANTLAFLGEFNDAKGRAKALGFYSTLTGICNIIAPVLGGVVNDVLNWRWAFYLALPIGVVVFLILLLRMPNVKIEENSQGRFDIIGTISLIIAVTCLVLTFNFGGSKYAWGSPQIIILILGFIVGLVIFLLTEKKVANPIIPLSLFKDKNFTLAVVGVVMIAPAMFAAGQYISLYAQSIRGLSATMAGTLTTIGSVGQLIIGYLFGLIVSKSSKVKPSLIVCGILGALTSIVLMAVDPTTVLVLLFATMFVNGVRNGIYMSGYTTYVQNELPKERIGIATSTVQFLQSLAGTIGVSIVGMVLAANFAKGLKTVIPIGLTDLVSLEELKPYLTANFLIPAKASELKDFAATLPGNGAELFNQLVENVRNAYSGALNQVYLVMLILGLIGLVATLFLKERSAARSK